MRGKDMRRVERTIYFCAGGSCAQKGSGLLIRESGALLRTEGLHSRVHTIKTLCTSHCDQGPIMAIQPDNAWYCRMDAEKSGKVIREHVLQGRPREAWFLDAESRETGGDDTAIAQSDLKPFEPHGLPEWGNVQAAAMDPWEINLYPLMKDLFVNRFQGLIFESPSIGCGPFSLNRAANLNYDGVCAEVESLTQRFSLVIGLFKETDPDYPRLWRDRITEVLFIESGKGQGAASGRMLVATSRSGVRALIVRFPPPDSIPGPDPWEHYTRIYLERN
jgi:(2Fe-2S) ferredoxin